jgi:hypothetical protein
MKVLTVVFPPRALQSPGRNRDLILAGAHHRFKVHQLGMPGIIAGGNIVERRSIGKWRKSIR